MSKRNDFSIEISEEQFEKVINDLGLTYSEPWDYFKADDGYVFYDYWHHEATGLTLASRFNGYRDDPASKPRYLISEATFDWLAEKAGAEVKS